jgi:hypothetical protein
MSTRVAPAARKIVDRRAAELSAVEETRVRGRSGAVLCFSDRRDDGVFSERVGGSTGVTSG